MDPKKLSDDQIKLLERLNSVKSELSKNSNVLAIGIGIKETNNQFTDEISYRVFVAEKKDKTLLSKNELIPDQIGDFKTDVLTPYVVRDRVDVCGDERRTLSKHRPLQAGIAISTDSDSYGTLGWFGKLDADNTPILLTNKHVLWDTTSEVRTDKRNVAQPQLGKVSNCCCCSCGSDNVIGETIVGIKDTATLTPTSVDCAIAKINSEFASDIVFNITNDSTSEVLTVDGTAAAVVGETVRKIGARSAFTRGTVVHIGDTAVAGTDPLGGTISIRTGQVLVIPTPEETYQLDDDGTCKFAFSNNGDSGSVIINASNQIVALLYGGDEKSNSVDVTFANNINNVLTALSNNGNPISLSTSGASPGARKAFAKSRPFVKPQAKNQLEIIRDLNRASLLHRLYMDHFEEVLDLINHCRPVTLAWQRNQGPAYVAALGRAAKVDHYRIPYDIEGASRAGLLNAMKNALMENGSEKLKTDLSLYADRLMTCMEDPNSIEGFGEALLRGDFLMQLPALSDITI